MAERRGPRPAPDASFQSTDVTEFALRPDPDVIAGRMKEAAGARAIREGLKDRDRIDAEQYGVPLVGWQLMGDQARREVIEDYNRRTQGTAGTVNRTINHGELGGTREELETQYERAVRDLEADKAEARQFTILCRPVVNHPRWGRVHQQPGTVKTSRRQVGKKLGQGFTYYPEAGFIPDPTIVCTMCVEANTDPPFYGYPDKDDPSRSLDIERHQRARHPDEFAARERQQNRIGQDDMRTLLTRQGDLIEMLAKQLAGQRGE